MAELNKQALMDLLKRPGNDKCADCGAPEPDWASYNLGIFVCVKCVAIHRMLGTHITKVKSLHLDNWNDDQVEFMAAAGNLSAKEKYEQYVPPCVRRPGPTDCHVLREQWIRAKYERHEFMDVDKQTYLHGKKDGFLWKRGKEDNRFQSRLFMLDEEENCLKYYQKPENKEPKAILRLSEINATFCPEKIGNPNGLQLSYVKDGTTRNLYVYSDDGQDIVDWYNAIRSASYNRLKIAYPGANDADLVKLLTREYVKEGYLYKTGPKGKETFRKRWFTLDDRRLMYYSDPLDAHPKGEFFIGYKGDGYTVRDGLPPGLTEMNNTYAFTVATPDRNWYFCSECKEDQEEWIDVLKKTTDRVLYPQEQSAAAAIVNKRSAPLSNIKEKITN
ncbi:arf-GAP with dual PH domain-containing protein 1-like isoform X1 [Ptychodera flava]|uniref:arf-GAP with dual PH domain-containing protein 1-like isoform X1 n=1 Tax=Ptychodera flava TaxID=63121 RepID=UPI003969D85C